jgi:hypothetical protein
VKNLFTTITGIYAREKARMVLTLMGLSVLGFALVAGLLLTFHECATAHFESTPTIQNSTSSKG